MLIGSLPHQIALAAPSKIALIDDRRFLSYADLDASANALANSLRALGIARGDRVALRLPNSIEAVIAIFGILKAGAAFVVLDPELREERQRYILGDAAPALLIGETYVRGVPSRSPGPVHLAKIHVTRPGDAPLASFAELLKGPSNPPNVPLIDLDLAGLIYTSGSTGRPKGVTLTHLNIRAALESITTYLRHTADDIILTVLPLAFTYGLYQPLLACFAGATLVLERSFAYPQRSLSRLVAQGATGLPMVPTMVALMLQNDLSRHDLSALRYITLTGAVTPTPHIKLLRSLLPHVSIYSMFGLTECARVAYLEPDEIDCRPSSVGRPIPNVEAFIVDNDGHRIVGSGAGELVVRGANVMAGYWNKPDETALALRPGDLPGQHLLHTGDLFRVDDDLYLYYLGRMDDLIKCGDRKVSPREVEDALAAVPGIGEAIVVGQPDRFFGQVPVAFIVRRPDTLLTEQEVLRHCSTHLERYMVPARVHFVDVLPKTSSGKIDRRQLAESGQRQEVIHGKT